jgi:hypothetical protein
MDFVWIANDQGDITGITATSPLTGGGTSGAITVGIQDGTTAQKGAVQLENSTSSTSTTTAAVPAAVKTSYDLAAAAIPKSTVTTAGDVIYATGAGAVTRLGIGTTGQVLSVAAGVPSWATVSGGGFPAWTSYTPTVTATIGTITSYTAVGLYSQSGKTVCFTAKVTISNAGSGQGTLVITLPITAQTRTGNEWMGTALEGQTTGAGGWGSILSGSSSINCRTYNFGTLIGTGNTVTVSATYEVA